ISKQRMLKSPLRLMFRQSAESLMKAPLSARDPWKVAKSGTLSFTKLNRRARRGWAEVEPQKVSQCRFAPKPFSLSWVGVTKKEGSQRNRVNPAAMNQCRCWRVKAEAMA